MLLQRDRESSGLTSSSDDGNIDSLFHELDDMAYHLVVSLDVMAVCIEGPVRIECQKRQVSCNRMHLPQTGKSQNLQAIVAFSSSSYMISLAEEHEQNRVLVNLNPWTLKMSTRL